MKEKVRIGLVGSGWVSTNRHAPALLQSKLFNVVFVASPNKETGEKLARICNARFLHGLPHDGHVEYQSVDALMIGTPPRTHYNLAKSALLAGKHVLLEKPMTMTPAESTDLITIAAQKKCVLNVVHNFQFAYATLRLKDLLERGALGTINSVVGVQFGNHQRRLPKWYEELPLGLFYDESPHLFYLMRLFTGELDLVSCYVRSSTRGLNTPSIVSAEFNGALGPHATLHLNFESAISEWYLIISCSKKMAVIDIFRDILYLLPNDSAHTAYHIARTSAKCMLDMVAGYLLSGTRMLTRRLLYGNDEVVKRFYKNIMGLGDANGIGGNDGLAVNVLQHKIIEQARTRDE